jgi:hypothetical protein
VDFVVRRPAVPEEGDGTYTGCRFDSQQDNLSLGR